MIERVARAIFNCPAGAEEFHPKWDSMTDEWKSESLMKARAAIEAMREPTDEMLVAGRVGEGGRTQAEDVWADMIAAALSENEG